MTKAELEELYKKALAEIERLTVLLTKMQSTLEAALEGNVDLRRQLEEVQAKLDVLVAKKKIRDRKDFGS